MTQSKKLHSGLLAALVVLLGSFSSAIAQEETVEEAAAAGEAAGAAEDGAEDGGEVIVITGSAIARKETMTPAPVAIMDKEELAASGMVSVGEILQNLPSQSNAINVQFNNGGDGSTRINMRGLGAGRTLVLVNGRRHVPGGTGANASVDLNAIPIAIIERVEVLKDGASAVYGSDAIGGVVNIITRQDYEGTEANLYTGTTGQGDGQVYDVSVVTGISSKKGSFLFSAGYYEQKSIMAGERAFSEQDKFFDFECVKAGGPATLFHPTDNPDGCIYPNGSSATPEGTIIDYGEDTSPEWDDAISGTDQTGAYWNPGGVLSDLDGNGNSDDGTGSLYNYQPENYLLTPQKRYNVYGQGRWHLRDDVDAFFESSYTRRKSDQLLAPTPLFIVSEGLTVSADNIYNPYNRDFVDVRRRMVEADRRNFLQEIDTMRLVAGLDGDLPMKDWKWHANYNFGRTSGIDVNEGRFVRSRVENAIGPSYRDADGVARCGTPAAPIPDCVPLNLFGGAGSITQEQLNYIQYTGIGTGYTMQNSAQIGAAGKLGDTPWDGFAGLAVGGEFRRLRGEFTPDPITASGDTTGNKAEPTGGFYDVYEGYAELAIVPITGHELARWFEVTLAARVFDYSTFGTGLTGKGGLLWRAPAGVSLRGTYSTAFRAPSIGALFAGTSDSFPAVTDPCDTSLGPRSPAADAQCQDQGIADDFTDIRTQLKSRVGGNEDAQEETAVIITAGMIYEPPAVEGLAFTADYFWVEIEDSITTIGAGIILSNCYDRGIQADCDKITRDPSTDLITEIDDRVTNIGGSKTAGVDVQVRYDWTGSFGRLRHNLEATWLQKFNARLPDNTVIEGTGVYDLGVYPSLKGNFATLWSKDDVGAGLNVRYIGNFIECQDDSCESLRSQGGDEFADSLSRDVDANVTADVFAQYETKSSAGLSRLTLGVNNVMDQDPPLIYNGFLGTSDAATYDYMGRYVYLRYMQSY